jgi:hypothetical protein
MVSSIASRCGAWSGLLMYRRRSRCEWVAPIAAAKVNRSTFQSSAPPRGLWLPLTRSPMRRRSGGCTGCVSRAVGPNRIAPLGDALTAPTRLHGHASQLDSPESGGVGAFPTGGSRTSHRDLGLRGRWAQRKV